MVELSWQDVQRIHNAAFLGSQVACAMIEAMGMQAENQYRESAGLSPAYIEAAFADVINKYGIGHNSALTTLQNGL